MFRVFLDPVERDAFKETDPAIRKERGTQPSVTLSATDERELAARYARRHAVRRFSLKPISLASLSNLLESVRRVEVDGKHKYAYSLAGGVYPNQVYLHVKPGRVDGLTSGTYYYHPVEHSLQLLEPDADLDRSIHIPFIKSAGVRRGRVLGVHRRTPLRDRAGVR